MKLHQIVINFPTEVEVPDVLLDQITKAVDAICKNYERSHPDRVMWAAGVGQRPKYNWHRVGPFVNKDGSLDESGLQQEYDEASFEISVAEREHYKFSDALELQDIIAKDIPKDEKDFWVTEIAAKAFASGYVLGESHEIDSRRRKLDEHRREVKKASKPG